MPEVNVQRKPTSTVESMSLGVSFVAMLPFALLQLAFMGASTELSHLLFGYGVIELARVAVFVPWLLFCAAEVTWRFYFANIRFPYFSLVGALLLMAFFMPATAIRSTLATMPRYCTADQVIQWQTSKGKFTLVLSGTGTVQDYEFSNGFMNWSGDGRAGFSSIHFKPIQFQYDYFEPHHDGSLATLRDRIAASGLPDGEVVDVSKAIWSVLELANRGEIITSPTGKVNRVKSGVSESWNWTLGGLIWLAILFAAFLTTGILTVRPRRPVQAAKH